MNRAARAIRGLLSLSLILSPVASSAMAGELVQPISLYSAVELTQDIPAETVSPETFEETAPPGESLLDPDHFKDPENESLLRPDVSTTPATDPSAEKEALQRPFVLKGILSKTEEYPLDLATVLQLVETQNLEIGQQRAGASASHARYFLSMSEWLPDISGTYDHSRFQGGVQIFGGQTLQIYRTTIQPQVTATWQLYPGGKTWFDMLAARRRYKSAKAFRNETLQQQMARATEEYYNFLQTQLDREVALKNLQEATEQVTLNSARLDAGVGTKLDLMRAKTEQADRERALIEAENNIALAEQSLLNRLNLDIFINLVPRQTEAVKRSLVPDTLGTTDLVTTALKNHPSVNRLAQEMKALKSEAWSALSQVVPSVTLQAFANQTGPVIHDLALSRFAGISVQSNLLDNMGFAIPLRFQEKRKEAEQKELELAAQIRTVETGVINAFLNSRASLAQTQVAREGLAAAEEGYRLAIARFRAGVGINLDVLDAQAALTEARQQDIQAILNYNRAQVQLLEAIGEATPDNILYGYSISTATKK